MTWNVKEMLKIIKETILNLWEIDKYFENDDI